ncbi:Hypothetical predicted protein [Olea europaea subsp. europaea]|uniref:Uncharacterized protein n=1 Tax=Olea europaea subsp. europaea TaxID=158383 RepID=A0A8S0UJ40_OLEEU|nr:Hypothetical predicted protein [Olea europaea subsp. europaea]
MGQQYPTQPIPFTQYKDLRQFCLSQPGGDGGSSVAPSVWDFRSLVTNDEGDELDDAVVLRRRLVRTVLRSIAILHVEVAILHVDIAILECQLGVFGCDGGGEIMVWLDAEAVDVGTVVLVAW